MIETIETPTLVRQAHDLDVPALVDMGMQFANHYPVASEVDPYALDATIRQLIANDDAAVLVVSHQGSDPYAVLVGMEIGLWFAPDTRVASELAWWVDPSHRGGSAGVRLIRAFERWAKARGIEHVCMSDIQTNDSASAGPLIERQGYQLQERSYIKRVSTDHGSS